MIVVRQSPRKTKMTRTTSPIAEPTVTITSRIDSLTASVVSKAISYFMPGGKRLERRSQFGDALAMNIESVGSRELRDGEANRIVSVVVEVRAVVFGAELGVTDIPEANERAVGIALEDDVVKLRRFRQAADGADADLKLLAGQERAESRPVRRRLRRFAPARALTTSSAVRARPAMRTGSSHRRMEYLRSPKMMTSATPGTRFRAVANVNIEVVAHKERGVDCRRANRRRRQRRSSARSWRR